MCAAMRADMRADICADVCADMCADMCTHRSMHTRKDKWHRNLGRPWIEKINGAIGAWTIDVRADMCIDTRMHM